MAGLSDILTTAQQGVTAVNGLATQFGKIGRSWTPYILGTPFSQGGSIVVSGTNGRFSQIGKTTFVSLSIAMSSGGAGTGFIAASLPTVCSGGLTQIIPGRENAVTGNMLQAITGASSVINILTYNNAYAGGNGYVLLVSGVYESA